MARLLLIDDDPLFLPEQVRQAFPWPQHEVIVAATGRSGIEQARTRAPDVILLDLRLPDQSGLSVYAQLRDIDPAIPVIFITAARTVDSAIEAMKQGAFNYVHKPLDLRQLLTIVGEAFEVAERTRHASVANDSDEAPALESDLLGSSAAMLEIWKAIGRVAQQDLPVLITGESGTGKELAAYAIHRHSGRASGPFLALNCAAIPEGLLESELFGHEKGAFTGAERRYEGKFEQCNGGTLLLDEIGDMPLGLQAKILRVLQEQAFQRVGGTTVVHTDVRVLACTHHTLPALVSAGRFRADLFYRLAVFSIELPPLRERGDDLAVLTRHFVARFNRELRRDVRVIAPEAMACLERYHWPGNVRELQSVLKQALLRASGHVLLDSFLPRLAAAAAPPPAAAEANLAQLIAAQLAPDASNLYAHVHDQVDRALLTSVLDHTHGNQRRAARMLGIARQTMRSKLRALGLQVSHSVASDDDA